MKGRSHEQVSSLCLLEYHNLHPMCWIFSHTKPCQRPGRRQDSQGLLVQVDDTTRWNSPTITGTNAVPRTLYSSVSCQLARSVQVIFQSTSTTENGVSTMSDLMTSQRIRSENQKYRGTAALSQNNRDRGFRPAFCDMETGRVELSCFAPGVPAPIHLLWGLPDDWVLERDQSGVVSKVKASVAAGFVRDDRFYTREEAALAVAELSIESARVTTLADH